jgi:hypothetical protein
MRRAYLDDVKMKLLDIKNFLGEAHKCSILFDIRKTFC